MGDLFSDFAEVFDSKDAPEGKPACGARQRNATCVRTLDHPGWHRSKTGVCWPQKKEATAVHKGKTLDGVVEENVGLKAKVEELTRWQAWARRRINRALHNVEEGREAERELKAALLGPPKDWKP